MVQGILHKTGPFFEKMRAKALSDELSVQIPTADHMYSEASDISLHDFEARTEMHNFEILEWLENFRPTSVGTEQMFSFARLSIKVSSEPLVYRQSFKKRVLKSQ